MQYFKATQNANPITIISSESKCIDKFWNTKYNFQIIDEIDWFEKILSISEKAFLKLKKLEFFNNKIKIFKRQIWQYEQIEFEELSEEEKIEINSLSKNERIEIKQQLNKQQQLDKIYNDFVNWKEIDDEEIDNALNGIWWEVKINDEEYKKEQKEFEKIKFSEEQDELFKQIINEEKKMKNHEPIDEKWLKLLDILPFDLLPLQHKLNLS